MKKSHVVLGLIFLTFFVISFLTNILGPLVPDIIKSFSLSLRTVALLPFAFFIAYGYIVSVGFWAKPLVNNETISLKSVGNSKVALENG